MPAISAGDLTKLRTDGHKAQFFMSVCPATVLWSARVNNGSIATGAYAVAFDGGAGLSFTAVGEWQEVWVGSSAGKYDKGRFRIKSVTSADSGVTGTVYASLNSIPFSDNDYLTFILWYLPKPRRPKLDSAGVFYKDGGDTTGGVVYTSQNYDPKPVCIAGENRAGFLSGGSFVIESQLPDSYATKSGAVIDTYSATAVYPTTGLTISIDSGTGVGTITFTAAGTYWIKWRCVDDNGVGQDTYRFYMVYQDDPAANYPETNFTIGNLSGDWNSGGWQATVTMNDNATVSEVPDLAPVILWQRSYYQDTEDYITFLPDSSNTLINGYMMRDRFPQPLQDGVKAVDFTIATINQVMAQTYNFSMSLESVNAIPSTWYQYTSDMLAGEAVHHFLAWHTTALQVCDVFGLITGNADHRIAYAEFEDGNLWSMPDSFIRDRSIRHHLVCDKGGRIHMCPDVQLLPDSDRSALVTVADLENTDNLDKTTVTLMREQAERTPFVHVSGFSWDGSYDADNNPNAVPRCAISPGDNVGDRGVSNISLGRQTFSDATHAAEIAGRVYSAANNEYPELRIDLHGNYLGVLDVCYDEFWTMSLQTYQTGRGIIWTAKKLIVRNVSASIDTANGTISCNVQFEPEAKAQGGKSVTCPSYPDIGGIDYTVPVDEEAGGGLITAGSVYRQPAQSLVWSQVSSEATNDLIIDPYWHSTKDSYNSQDAIVWRCGTGYIKRSNDGGSTWSAVTPSSDPPNDASDSPAPTVGNVIFAQLDADYSQNQKFIAVARWQNGSSEWRTWYCYTDDNGASWTWVSLTDGGSGGGGGTITVESPTTTTSNLFGSFCWLTDTKMVSAYTDDTDLIMKVGDLSGVTITYGATQTKNVTDLCSSIVDVIRMSDSTFAVLWYYYDGESSDLYVTVGSVSGTTITYGTTDIAIDAALTGPYDVAAIALLTTAKVVIGYDAYAVIGSVSGSGTGLTISLGSVADAGADIVKDITVLDVDKFIFLDGSAPRHVAIAGSVSGTTITFGSPVEISAYTGNGVDGQAVRLSSTQFVALLPNGLNLYANVCNVSGTTITAGTETAIATTTPDNMGSRINATGLDATSFAVIWDKSTTSGYINIFDNALAPLYTQTTFSTEVDTGGAWKIDVSAGGSLAIAYPNSGGTNDTVSMISYAAGASGFQVKGYGIAIDKSGLYYYMTAWKDGDTVRLFIIDASDDSLLVDVNLGPATVAQLDAKTYSAYPYSPFDYSVDCYVFGLMSNPAGLSGSQHVISLTYEGVGASIINAWGSNIAGAIIDDGENLYAIRNGTSAKLYNGTGAVLSTLPIAGVNPHGIAFDDYNSVIYVASNAAGATMILKSFSPYTSWVDITYAHGVAAGVKSIRIL